VVHIPAVGLELHDGFKMGQGGCVRGGSDFGDDRHGVAPFLVAVEPLSGLSATVGSGANANMR
jgi:hypothetical protein